MSKVKSVVLGIILVVLVGAIIFFIANPNVFTKKEEDNGKIKLVSSNFASEIAKKKDKSFTCPLNLLVLQFR